MITVNSPEQAVQMAKELAEQGFGAIEVCGAFGEELARKMYEATGNKVSVGYIVCSCPGSKRTVRSFLAGITT